MHMRMADNDEFCVSDEEFWQSLAGSCTDTDEVIKDQNSVLRARPYKLDFGIHQGLTFDEVPVAYIDWLVRNEINYDREDFRAALDEYRGTQKANVQPLSPTTSNAKRKRTFSQTGLPSNSAISRKQPSAPQGHALPKENSQIPEVAGPSSDLYRLSFGKYAGQTLDELPSSYINWLLKNGISKSNPDLASALEARGRSGLGSWTIPKPPDTQDPRFFDPDTYEALWIAKTDTWKYFKIDVHLLALANVLPLAKGDRRYWLYPIYVCAKHFRTVVKGTADQALAEFLDKNRYREQEIMAGFNCCCPHCCGED